MNKKEAFFLLSRYTILIILGIPNLLLFYIIFTPLTVYPIFWILNFFYDAILYPLNVIFFKGYFASIIPACVAGAAYYLLLILNLITPSCEIVSIETKGRGINIQICVVY